MDNSIHLSISGLETVCDMIVQLGHIRSISPTGPFKHTRQILSHTLAVALQDYCEDRKQ